jgi:hypothetical protein
VNTVISVMPMVSAAAVAATRCGLRRPLAVASRTVTAAPRPAAPPSRAPRPASPPSTPITGGAISGMRANRATKHAHPPAAITRKADRVLPLCVPATVSSTPAAPVTAATVTRNHPVRRVTTGAAAEPSAATGATRVAALEGSSVS